MMTYIFIGGKGGVGKSTIASALALHYSREGKTLLVSTDPVYALSDIWETKLSKNSKEVRSNLFAKHINPDFFKVGHPSPCESEKTALSEFAQQLVSDEYEKTVFDTAPTGHTLAMLKLPGEWKEFIEKTPFACGGSETDAKLYGKIIDVLKSDAVTFNFVLIPERLSLNETERAVVELKKLGISRFGFVMNMVIPKSAARGDFMLRRYEMQQRYINESRKKFGCCVRIVTLKNSEVGRGRLEEVEKEIFSLCC